MTLSEFHDLIRPLVSTDGKTAKCFCCLIGQIGAEEYKPEGFYVGWKIYCTTCNMIDCVLDSDVVFFVSENLIIS